MAQNRALQNIFGTQMWRVIFSAVTEKSE